MTDFTITFRDCDGAQGQLVVADAEAFQKFATYADLLFLGRDVPVDLPDARKDAHIIQVIISGPDQTDGKLTPISSLYMVCECIWPVDKDTTVKSELYTPQPVQVQHQLIVPKGTKR